jgi:hypothetical protein
MFYLFGVDHEDAQTYLGVKQSGNIRLENALIEQFGLSTPLVVAEEMNRKMLNGRNSIAEEFAQTQALKHEFCEPCKEWRLANGCFDVDTLQRELGSSNESYIRNNLRLAAEAVNVAINYPKREQFWLDRLKPFHQSEVFFIFGYDHIESFRKLLTHNYISHSLVARDIGVTAGTKTYRLQVRNYLEDHPDLVKFVFPRLEPPSRMEEVTSAMGWENFNLNLMESADFSINAQNVILRVFDSASNALDEEWKRESESYKKAVAEAYKIDEAEGNMMSQEWDWEEDLHRQRKQGVGALALDWLMWALQGALHSAKKYLNLTHPAKGPYYKKQGWLGEVTDEYRERFGIDFAKGPVTFERIQELVLARNAGIHRDKGNLESYLHAIKHPRFVDGEDRFFVTRTGLVSTLQECEQFLRWIVAEIEKLGPSPRRSK